MRSLLSKKLTFPSPRYFSYSPCNMTKFIQFANKSSPDATQVGILNPETGSILNITEKYTSIESILKNDQLHSIKLENFSVKDTIIASEFKANYKYRAPIMSPEKLLCIGKNYIDHVKEMGEGAPPSEPLIFNKLPSSITHHEGEITNPRADGSGAKLDWEGELAVVIGKAGKHIKKENAMEHVAGYTLANDVSARDWQKKRNKGQWLIGKSFDTFCPLGPVFTTRDEIDDVQNLDIQTIVNGKVEQSSNTKNMIFDIATCIEWMSQFWEFKAGDVILTGTPDGVGAGQNPPVILKHGDEIIVKIEKLGELRNVVFDEFHPSFYDQNQQTAINKQLIKKNLKNQFS